MTRIKDYYTQRIRDLELDKKKIRKTLRVLGWSRLLAFIFLIIAVFGVIPKMPPAGIALFFFSLVFFLFLIKKYLINRSRLQHITALLSITEKEVQALDHNFSGFDEGEEFTDPNHAYSFDMDLFGKESVFQYINRTVTCEGKRYFARLLSNETLNSSSIENRQTAIKELVEIQDELQNFRATGTIHQDSEDDLNLINEWISKKTYFTRTSFFSILAITMSVVTLCSVIVAVFIPFLYGLPIILYILNLIIVSWNLKRTNEEHNLIGKRLNSLKKYAALIKILEHKKFQSTVLKRITDELISGQLSAARSISRLSRVVSAFDNRMNLLAASFLEGLLLWDIQCMIRLEKWRSHEGISFNRWITALAEFDALASLAIYAFNHKEYAFPEIVKTPVIEAINLGHILIPDNERICNDFCILQKGDYVIITGANMAGKSTFLRTVATSMIIAMTGAPVCASAYRFFPMSIFSSMRTNDSLNKHESHFYAELKRLKESLDRLRNGEKLFIILDEILKGTNSYDKQKGSYAAMEQIIKFGGTGIVATHDLELAKIEKKYPEKVKNLCFEIEIDQAKIYFDYKLKEGITTKMNASLLMQQMGIID